MFSLTWSQPFWSFLDGVVSLLLLSPQGPCKQLSYSIYGFFQIELRVPCLLYVLLQDTFLVGHVISVSYIPDIWFQLSQMSGSHTPHHIHIGCSLNLSTRQRKTAAFSLLPLCPCGKELLVPNRWMGRHTPEPDWTRWQNENDLTLSNNRIPILQPQTTVTEQSWMTSYEKYKQ